MSNSGSTCEYAKRLALSWYGVYCYPPITFMSLLSALSESLSLSLSESLSLSLWRESGVRLYNTLFTRRTEASGEGVRRFDFVVALMGLCQQQRDTNFQHTFNKLSFKQTNFLSNKQTNFQQTFAVDKRPLAWYPRESRGRSPPPPPQAGFLAVIFPGFPGYVLYPSAQVAWS